MIVTCTSEPEGVDDLVAGPDKVEMMIELALWSGALSRKWTQYVGRDKVYSIV